LTLKSPFSIGVKTLIFYYRVSLDFTSVPVGWQLNSSNGSSREHECHRLRQTDRPRDYATEKCVAIGGITRGIAYKPVLSPKTFKYRSSS